MTESTIQDQDQLREAVRQRYAAAATRVTQEQALAESALPILNTSSCCSTDPACSCESAGDHKSTITSALYALDEVADLPSAAVLASLGCGNPTALAELRQGDTVLDLGSGGGIDVLLSAKRVGPTGFAYGLDMTDEMLALAEKNRQERGVHNARFLKGHIEQIPLPNDSVDVIISNCVINLSGDKPLVLREAVRVLKPGGRFAVSDVVVQGELPAALRKSMELWAGCIAGALDEIAYRRLLSEAGFVNVEVEVTRVYDARDLAASECSVDSLATRSGFADLAASGGRLVSAFVRATRPTAAATQPIAAPANDCCSSAEQSTCCESSDKAACCETGSRVNILRVRLPLKVVNAAAQRATGRTLIAPYYGWVLVGALGATEVISWGVLYYAFSVFLTPMETDLGWSRTATTGAFSLALVLSGFAAIGAGHWLDRHGARVLMTAGSCMGVVLVLAWSAANTLIVFYVVWAAIGVVMATVLYEPAFAVITVWFDQKRVRALTAVTLIAGFSSTIFLPLSAWLVEAQGWRTALVSLAVILAVGTIPAHALLLRRRPEDLGLHPDGQTVQPPGTACSRQPGVTPRAALRDPTFRWVTLAFCLSSAVAFGAQLHLVPILLERGFSPTLAATIAGLIGATQVLGRVLMIPFTGRVSLRSLTVAVLAIQPVALLVLLLVPELAGVIGFVVLFGAAKGCLTLVRPAFVADLYGPAHYASIAGVLAFSVTIAQAAAPLGAGAAYDALGRYDPILWMLVLVSALASLCLLPARRATDQVAEPRTSSGLSSFDDDGADSPTQWREP